MFLTTLRGSADDWRYRIKDQLDEEGINVPIFRTNKGDEILNYLGEIITTVMNKTVDKIVKDLEKDDLG